MQTQFVHACLRAVPLLGALTEPSGVQLWSIRLQLQMVNGETRQNVVRAERIAEMCYSKKTYIIERTRHRERPQRGSTQRYQHGNSDETEKR